MNAKTCPICHSPIPENAPGGLCPACVLRDAEDPAPAGRGAPSLGEIAAAFPQLEVFELVGQGGMGFVYKVRQPSLDRIVALKVLSPELGRDPAFAERFAREARTLGKLHHPNIVTVFEHGESGGFFYLVMEYIDGVNLRQAMRAGRFTPEQALGIVPGVCDALQAAHAQGIWHRDIKPENILLDRDGRVKIADFGIARIVGDPQRDFTLTMTGGQLGSAAYMAPEQHEKPHDVDHRADIYSLGVVIYEMLTGELPLGRFPAPSQRAAVNARIDEIVFRTLEKERELRQQSASEVKTEVEEAAGREANAGLNSPSRKPGSSEGNEDGGAKRAFRAEAWSVGLWIGGIAAVVAGSVTAPLVFGIGCVVAVLGLLGCGWILRRIRLGEHPPEHRRALLAIAYWPVVTGLAWAAVLLWFVTFKRPSTAEIPELTGAIHGFAILAVAAPLTVARLLWNLFGSDSSQAGSGRSVWVRVICAVTLLFASLALVKWIIARETAYRSYKVGVIQIHGEIHEPEEHDLMMVREAVSRAVGEHVHRYRIHTYGANDTSSPWDFPNLATPYVVLEWSSLDTDSSQKHFESIAQRMRASLPKRIGVNSQGVRLWFPYQKEMPAELQQDYRRTRQLNIVLLLAPILTVLLIAASKRPPTWLLPILALALAFGIDRAPWPNRLPGLPPSIHGVTPLPPLSPPEYDFSTTRDAMESMIKAAKKADVEAFKRGVSRKLLDKTMAEAADFSEPMREIAKLTYHHQVSQNGHSASVQMTIKETKKFMVMPLVREHEEWKITLPEDQP